MIEEIHREMVLDMFRRGMTIPSIFEAMRPALTIECVRVIIAETNAADRRAAAMIRRRQLKADFVLQERARLKAERDRKARIAGYRVLTVRPLPGSRKSKQKEHHHGV